MTLVVPLSRVTFTFIHDILWGVASGTPRQQKQSSLSAVVMEFAENIESWEALRWKPTLFIKTDNYQSMY